MLNSETARRQFRKVILVFKTIAIKMDIFILQSILVDRNGLMKIF